MSKQPFTISSKLADLPHLPLSSLTELQGELKDLTTKNYNKLKRSLSEFGIFVPIFVWQNSGHNYILDGHQRKRVLVKEGYTGNVPVVYVEADNLKEAKEKLLVISSQYGTISQEGYDTFTFDLDNEWLDSTVYFDALHFEFGENGQAADGRESQDAEPQIDRAKELQEQWGTELGQLWQIGEHRLICGDCTDKGVVERVMRGEKAEMMFTDPPYGVGYTGGHFHSGNVNIKREREKLSGDKEDMYGRFLPVVLPFIDGPCYVWFADRGGKPVYDVILGNGCEIHAMIIWNKTNATYAAMNAQYKQRHEPCMYFKPKRSTLRWVGATNECTIWDIPRDPINELHPTQKPIALAQRAINNHEASLILDVFAGSGSTGIACQNLGRKARMIEISPAYCAVILQRFSDAFPDIEIKLIQ